MNYLLMAFVISWLLYFIYLFMVDRQISDLKRRLKVQEETVASAGEH